MNPLENLNPMERRICDKADYYRRPIGGNIELLPLCNMDCKMCFAKMTKKEMEVHHPLIPANEWIRLGKEIQEEGTLFMLFTGGEPFLYPDFKKVYQAYKKMGFIVSINTNGTLIDETIADYLAEDKPRRLNITMYGPDDETYARLCGNPHGFTQLMKAVKLLKDREIDIKFNCSLTPFNIDKQEEMYQIACEIDIPMEMGFYMFPPVRANNLENVKYRLSAKEAAKARFVYEKIQCANENLFRERCKSVLNMYQNYIPHKEESYEGGYTCRSGNSVFWINYDGTLAACSFTKDFGVDVFSVPFAQAWSQLTEHVGSSYMPLKCHTCRERVLCGVCASACYSESGNVGKVPEYYCELTKEYIRLIENMVDIMNHD